MKKDKLSRRNFLRNTTAVTAGVYALNPLEILLGSLVQGFCDTAYADETNATEIINYIHLSINGGAPRWMFDLPLLPMGAEKTTFANKMLITKVTNASQEEAHYEMMKFGKYYFPHFWNSKVANSQGGTRDVSELLNHIAIFRGINLQADGHGQNREKQLTPIPGHASLTGLAADRGSFPFPSVHYGGALGFRSPAGIGAVNATSGNPISRILSPFNIPNARSHGRGGDEVETLIDKVLAQMQVLGENSPQKTSKLFTDTKNAKKLFIREFGNLTEVYNGLHQKYEKLISDSLKIQSLSGVDDIPLLTLDNNRFRIQSTGAKQFAPGFDLRDALVSDGRTLGSANSSVINKNTSIAVLARNMALAEFITTNKLSSSLKIECGGMNNLNYPSIADGVVTQRTNANFDIDAHSTGAIPTMLYFSKYFQSVSACTLELFDKMKETRNGNTNAFDNSVFQISSDFNRSARGNGTGSDHGWNGSSATLFSGKIKSPIVMGNIKTGSFGIAAPVEEIGDRELVIGNIASTVAQALGTPSPTPNDRSLIKIEKGEIKPLLGEPKNV